jgi:hypothetical protein
MPAEAEAAQRSDDSYPATGSRTLEADLAEA